MSEQVKFGEIDFEAIEYRNEYRHTKAVFACLATQAYSLSTFLKRLDDSGAIDLSKARRRLPVGRSSMLKIWSRDRKRKIIIQQSLGNFDRFCDDLTERWRLAIDRYLGYAKGTSLRQPERHLKTQETLKAERRDAVERALVVRNSKCRRY